MKILPPEIIKKEGKGRRYVHTDQYGIIGHAYHGQGGVEGGDSACWNGHYNYFSPVKDGVKYVDTFEVKYGAYVRHPVPHDTFNRFGWFYKNPWDGNTSRDQLTGVLLGIIDEKNYGAMLRYFLHSALRLFIFAYNTRKNGETPEDTPWKMPDFLGPNMWQMMIRGMGPLGIILYPLLIIFDLQLLVDVFLINKTDKDDVINFIGRLSVARDILPTPVGWLAVRLLKKDHVKSLVERYWVGWRDNPGMYDLHAQAIERLK